MRPIYNSVLTLLLVCVLMPAISLAQVHLTGTLLGADGNPMPKAHVVVEAGLLDTPLVAEADRKGQFSVDLPREGGYGVYLMGPHHETREIPLIVHESGSVELHVRLGTADYETQPDSLWVATAVSDFKQEGAILMQRTDEGYSASVPIQSDTLAYQIRGLSRYAPAIGGTSVDRWVFSSDGPFWDFESDHISVLRGLGRETAEVTFAPSSLPPPGREAVIRSPDRKVEGIANIYLQTEAMERELGRKASSYRSLFDSVRTDEKRKALQDSVRHVMDRFADSLSAPITRRIETEEDPILRQWLLLRFFDELQGSEEDSLLARQALREVPPTSPFWSHEAWSSVGASNLITRLYRAAHSPDRVMEYVNQAIQLHPDADVRRQFLYAGVSMADHLGRDKRKMTYLGQLTTEFPDSRQAERVERRFGPERDITVGERIPDYSLPAMQDSSLLYTDENMEGQIYLIDVWAVWCGPCIAEMDELHAAYEKYQDEGFEILSISLDEARSDVQVFRENRWPMPWKHHFAGFSGSGRETVEETFEVTGVPRTILVDENGEIIATGEALRGSRLDSTLSAVMGDS